jgi:hypothetical protein
MCCFCIDISDITINPGCKVNFLGSYSNNYDETRKVFSENLILFVYFYFFFFCVCVCR